MPLRNSIKVPLQKSIGYKYINKYHIMRTVACSPLLWQFDLGHVVETEVNEILEELFSHVGLDRLRQYKTKENFISIT